MRMCIFDLYVYIYIYIYIYILYKYTWGQFWHELYSGAMLGLQGTLPRSRVWAPSACDPSLECPVQRLALPCCMHGFYHHFNSLRFKRIQNTDVLFSCTCSCLVWFKWNYEMYNECISHNWIEKRLISLSIIWLIFSSPPSCSQRAVVLVCLPCCSLSCPRLSLINECISPIV